MKLRAEQLEDRRLLFYNGPDEVLSYHISSSGGGDPQELIDLTGESSNGCCVSLGNGYTHVALGFINPVIVDRPGPDFEIVEQNNNEHADIFISKNYGNSWEFMASINGSEKLDLEGTGFEFINAVKIVNGSGNQNGYDIKLVLGLHMKDLRWVSQKIGDTNRDGVFDRSDIVQMLVRGKYLMNVQATWEDGDFNGDGRFNQIDLVLAMQDRIVLRHSNFDTPLDF